MSRGYRDNDSKRYFDWLYYAHIDLLAANELMEQPLCYNTVAFHCQQAIEKAIKGYLLYRRHRLYDGHNLPWLCKQAMQEDPHFGQWLDRASMLNRFYIEARYPADFLLRLDQETIMRVLTETPEMSRFIMKLVHFDFASYRYTGTPAREQEE